LVRASTRIGSESPSAWVAIATIRVLSAWYEAGLARLAHGASSGFGEPHALAASPSATMHVSPNMAARGPGITR
jgi:hypothetical protein